MTNNTPKERAEEILKKHINPDNKRFSLRTDKNILNAMQEFAESFAQQEVKKACKAQREILAQQWKEEYGFNTDQEEIGMNKIRNAPSPTLIKKL